MDGSSNRVQSDNHLRESFTSHKVEPGEHTKWEAPEIGEGFGASPIKIKGLGTSLIRTKGFCPPLIRQTPSHRLPTPRPRTPLCKRAS
jgi:hypothetical protein